MSEYIFKRARLLGKDVMGVHVFDGMIAAVSSGKVSSVSAMVVNASSLVVLLGLVGSHTYLREPGLGDSETVLTGSQTTVAGGYICVSAMANMTPVQDPVGVVEQVMRLEEVTGYVDARPVGAVSSGLEGKRLAELGAMAASDAQARYFSDDRECVSDPMLMRRALEYVKTFNGVVAQHAQDPRLTERMQMHEGDVSAELGLAGWPAVAEESIIAHDVLLAKHVGSKVHILHVSTVGPVDLVRWAKTQGIAVTAEATPHHLGLDHTEVRSYDPMFKINSPLRPREDVEALRRGVVDETIGVIGADHAPHPIEEKDCEWVVAASGVIGLEMALSVVQESLVDVSLIDWGDVARLMNYEPARICASLDQGRPVVAGEPANLCFVDPDAGREISGRAGHPKSHNTPWGGRTLPGRAMYTVHRGVPIVREGKPRSHGDVMADRAKLGRVDSLTV